MKRKVNSATSLAIFLTAGFAIFLAMIWLFADDAKYVLAPAVTAAYIAITFWAVSYVRDGVVPIFDAGSVCIAASVAYISIPLLGYALAGLDWSRLSDNRLQVYLPTPEEIGRFSWRGVLYLSCLAGSYFSLSRGNRPGLARPALELPSHFGAGSFALYVVLGAYFLMLQLVTGVDLNPSYEDLQGVEDVYRELPLLMRQVTGHLLEIHLVAKLALLFYIFQQSRRLGYRALLFGWLCLEVITPFVILGGRTPMVLFVMACVLLYHRVVAPIRLSRLIIFVTALFSAFLFQGFLRGGVLEIESSVGRDLFAAANEFQSTLATAYDVFMRKDTGGLPSIPWQFYLADFFRLIPQQLLPFEKIDPSDWYLDLLGVKGTGVGYTFGVLAESVVGLDWLELALRGTVLGTILALLHNYYLRHSRRLGANLFYLWLCIKMYFTFRLSTFYIVVSFVFQYVPAFFLLRYTSQLFRAAQNRLTSPRIHPIFPR